MSTRTLQRMRSEQRIGYVVLRGKCRYRQSEIDRLLDESTVSGDKRAASPDRLLTTREAAHLLNVSTRTLQRMRSEQRIGYVVLRGKCRYRQSEIDRLLEACAVNEDAATPQELKRNHTLRTGGKPKGRRT